MSLDLEEVVLERPVQRVKRVYFGPTCAFVPHPHLRGAWVKTHPCVVLVACPACESPKGFLCLGAQGFMVNVHFRRVDAAQAYKTSVGYALAYARQESP